MHMLIEFPNEHQRNRGLRVFFHDGHRYLFIDMLRRFQTETLSYTLRSVWGPELPTPMMHEEECAYAAAHFPFDQYMGDLFQAMVSGLMDSDFRHILSLGPTEKALIENRLRWQFSKSSDGEGEC